MQTKNIVFRLVLVLIIGIFVLGFSITSISNNPHIKILFPYLKVFYSKICHQIPNKSFIISDLHFLVCARCTGIYLGTFLTSIFFLIRYKLRINLSLNHLLLLVPMIIDIILYNIGIYTYSKYIAFFTGLPIGFMIISIIISIFANEIFGNMKKNDL